MNRAFPSSKTSDRRRPLAVVDLLARSEAFAALRAGVEQIGALQRDLGQLLPDYLAASVEPGFVKDGMLTVFAAHSALAARLRHLEPGIVTALQQRGWAVQALRLRIRPQPAATPAPEKTARMSRAGAYALHELSEALAPSPLRTALARMAERHRALCPDAIRGIAVGTPATKPGKK